MRSCKGSIYCCTGIVRMACKSWSPTEAEAEEWDQAEEWEQDLELEQG